MSTCGATLAISSLLSRVRGLFVVQLVVKVGVGMVMAERIRMNLDFVARIQIILMPDARLLKPCLTMKVETACFSAIPRYGKREAHQGHQIDEKVELT